MKKFISALLATVMLFSTIPMIGLAEETAPNESAAETNVSQEEMPGLGTEASIGDTVFYIEEGSLLRSHDSARPQTVDTDVSWVIARDSKIYWSKLEEHNTSTVYFCNASDTSGEALQKVFVPIEAFDISGEELYYLYNCEIVKVNMQTGKEETVGMFDCNGFYLREQSIIVQNQFFDEIDDKSEPDRIESLEEISLLSSFNLEELKANALKNWVSPIKAEIYSVDNGREFGATRNGGTRNHSGIDWIPKGSAAGTSVYAMDSGKVIQYCYGYYAGTDAIAVQNDSGGILVYGEIAPTKKNGDTVNKGEVIGTIKKNNYGNAMLHLELYAGTAEGNLFGFGKYNNINHPYLAENKNCWARSDLLDPTFLLGCSKSTSYTPPTKTETPNKDKTNYVVKDTSIKVNITRSPGDNFTAQSFSIGGTISSNYPINWVTAWLKNTTTGETISYYNNGWNAKKLILPTVQLIEL